MSEKELFSFPEGEKIISYNRDGIETPIYVCDHSFEAMAEDLDVTAEKVDGKKVLDIGAGLTQQFDRELEEKFHPDAVVSVDLLAPEKHHENYVRGDALRLPFLDKSFDTVFSHWSVPYYLRSETEVFQSLQEILRVLKDDGMAEITPLAYTPLRAELSDTHILKVDDYDKDPEFFDSIIERVQSENPSVQFEIVEVPPVHMWKGKRSSLKRLKIIKSPMATEIKQ